LQREVYARISGTGGHKVDTLEKRVEVLERENRRLRRGAVVALVLLGAVAVMGQAPRPQTSNELRTRRLLIMDPTGEPRAILQAPNGEPSLLLFGKGGMARAELGVINGDAALWQYDHTGKTQVLLGVFNDKPSLVLQDVGGYTAVLGASELMTPGTGTKEELSAASLVLYDKDKNVIWKAPR